MGRATESFRIEWPRGWARVRFTWQGLDHRIALGIRRGTPSERDAQAKAAREYAAIVTGQRKHEPRPTRISHHVDLPVLLHRWIESKRPSLDHTTVPTLKVYARLFVATFGELGAIDEASATTFGLERLGHALRKTVNRELAYLRQFLAWCNLHGHLTDVPPVPRLPPKASGTRTGTQRAKFVHVTPHEAGRILGELGDESKTIDGRKWPVRARFEFAWETALRPETLSRLRVPENWQPGMKHVELTDQDDKARYGRDVDLTPRAIAILRRVAPPQGGAIFGRHNFMKRIKRAAIAILGEARGRNFAPYDFRHGRAKALLDAGAPIRGVSYVLGHKKVSTTNIYLAPDRAAGAQAIACRLQQDSRPRNRPRRKIGPRGKGKTG